MNKVVWDKQTGGVLLQSLVTKETLGVSPRPVFYEELDLLGLDKAGWKYPRCQEPLMWACNKQYFYRGDLLFEAKGANIYDSATVVLSEGVQPMKLKPVDMTRMLEKNREAMFLLESEAIEFIRDTYETYTRATKAHDQNVVDYEQLAERQQKKTKQKMAVIKEDCDSFDVMPLEEAEVKGRKVLHTTKVDLFLASFSGGKDSQVVLDLCTRALPPSAFQVIYSDTGYELPSSLELYERVKEYYGKLYPDLKFSTARNHESVLNYWDKIGTPSDKHRWCCSVMKTAPLYRMLKIPGTNKQAKVLTFEGVRAEESTRRADYTRIGRGVKHSNTINARPILGWTITDVFLYLIRHNLPINPAYREGMTRVGCLICPFGSEWNEMVVQKNYRDSLIPFEKKLQDFSVNAGVKDIDNYIADGGWKRRGGGNYIKKESFVDIVSLSPNFVANIVNPKLPLTTFLPTIGSYSITQSGNQTSGEININGNIYKFKIDNKGKTILFEVDNILNAEIVSYLKRVLYKATFCIQCEVCEVECPTGALHILPTVEIDKTKCIRCKKCLDFHDKGCIVADSLTITSNMLKTGKTANIDRYKNFGLREEWLDAYLIDLDEYWQSDNGLNKDYQVPALKCYLKDAGVIDDKSNVTELGRLLSSIRLDLPEVVWSIIWTNLSYNSFIVNWYIDRVDVNKLFDSKLLEEMVVEEFPQYKSKTVHNAIYQLLRTLKESPIGETLCQYFPESKTTGRRKEYSDIDSIAVAYSLYKCAREMKVTSLRVSDFYSDEMEHGPFREFGLSKSVFESALRSLNSSSNRVLVAELNMGLDHITLRDDLDEIAVVKTLYGI